MKNIIINYFGQGSQILILFVSMPIFLNYLGPTAFGLIGIYTLMQAWFNLLDLGISPMLSRVFAQWEDNKENNKQLIGVLRSIEIILFFLSAVIILIGFLFSEHLVGLWLSSETFTTIEMSNIFKIFLFIIFARLFEGIYRSCLAGFQKHLSINLTVTIINCLKTAISIITLIYITTDVRVFFLIQLVFGIITMFSLLVLVYKSMPVPMWSSKFSFNSLKNVYKFSVGIAGITLLSLSLTHLDKLILTSYISVEEYGLYALAASVAAVIQLLITPIVISLGPKLAAFQKQNDLESFKKTFLFGGEFSGMIVCSLGGVFVIFSYEILSIWIGDTKVALELFEITTLLIIGNIFNSMMWLPYQAQLAHGWTSLSLITNLISIVVLIPLNFALIPVYGAYASASIWMLLNLSYIVFSSHFMFARILKGVKFIWFWRCVIKPLIISISIPLIVKLLCDVSDNIYLAVLVFAALVISSAILTIASSSVLKKQLFTLMEDY